MSLFDKYDHIIIAADCFDAMADLINDSIKVDCVITDLPYGVTNCEWDKQLDLKIMWRLLSQLIAKNTPVLFFGCEPFSSELRLSNKKDYKYDWIWEKSAPTGFFNAKKQPLRCYENISVFYTKQCLYNPQMSQGHSPTNSYTKNIDVANKSDVYNNGTRTVSGGGSTERYPRQVLRFKSDKQLSNLHPSQKPLDLLKYFVSTYTAKGDVVLDITAGSGTTGLACAELERKSIMIENNKDFVEVCSNRLAEFNRKVIIK